MRSRELFDQGDLAGAIAALNDEIKAQPGDLGRRRFLLELLCFAGDLDRAEKQIDALSRFASDPASVIGSQLLRNLLTAERERRACFQQGRKPRSILAPTPAMELALQALQLDRDGRSAEAAALVQQAEAVRSPCPGSRNGTPFDDLRDGDDLLAPLLEVYTPAGYFWIPWEHIQYLEVPPPARLLDLMWSPAKIAAFDGQLGEVHLPCLYPGTSENPRPAVRMGRQTVWEERATGFVRGAGLKDFLVGEMACSLLELGEISREQAATETL